MPLQVDWTDTFMCAIFVIGFILIWNWTMCTPLDDAIYEEYTMMPGVPGYNMSMLRNMSQVKQVYGVQMQQVDLVNIVKSSTPIIRFNFAFVIFPLVIMYKLWFITSCDGKPRLREIDKHALVMKIIQACHDKIELEKKHHREYFNKRH